MTGDDQAKSETVLVLTPSGGDASIVVQVLKSAGIRAEVCGDIFDLTKKFVQGAGALLIAEEGLVRDGVDEFCARLAEQAPWSDISILIVSSATESDETGQRLLRFFAPHGNVTLVERPLRPISLISAVHGALRTRRRQYDLRSILLEQERTLHRVREAEERFRAIFNQQFQFMAILSPEGVVTEINELPCRSTGIPREAIIGRKFWETPFWAHLPEMQREWPRRLAAAAQTNGPVITLDQYETAAGELRVADAAITAVKQSDSSVSFYIIQASDITERKAAERALESKRRRLELLANVARDLLSADSPERVARQVYAHLKDELGLDAYFNYLASTVPNRLRLDSFGGAALDESPANERSKFSTPPGLLEVASEHDSWSAALVQNSVDPRLAFARRLGLRAYASFPLLVDRCLIGTLAFGTRQRDQFSADDLEYLRTASNFVAIAQDRALYERDLERTVRDRTAELRVKVGELEAFSYSVSHDLRAPLRAMQGYAQLLMEDHGQALDEEGRDFLRRICLSAERLDLLVTDILTYSKVTRETIQTAEINPEKLIREVILTYPSLQKANIEIASPLHPVMGHEGSLVQCVSNLLGNALKFVEKGKTPRVQISSAIRDGHVRLSFKDNGIGISARDQERIFRIFEKAAHNGEYEGTGIGLAIVQKAVERMGGRTGVSSELGKGSEFWIELPRPL